MLLEIFDVVLLPGTILIVALIPNKTIKQHLTGRVSKVQEKSGRLNIKATRQTVNKQFIRLIHIALVVKFA